MGPQRYCERVVDVQVACWAAGYLWSAATIGFALSSVVLLGLSRIDGRQLDGESTWLKPFKFGVSLAVHFGTFAAITRYLPAQQRHSAWLQLTAAASVVAGLIVFGYIGAQAARRRRSHFSTRSSLEAALSILMGVGALVVLSPAVIIGVDVATTFLPGWTAALRLGVAIGLLAGVVLTLVTGMRMGAARSHFVGSSPTAPRLMRLTGWSLDAADLRPAHFLANHMMQALPLVAAISSLLLRPAAAWLLTVSVACGWVATTWAVFRAALAGKPLPRSWVMLARPIGKPLDVHCPDRGG